MLPFKFRAIVYNNTTKFFLNIFHYILVQCNKLIFRTYIFYIYFVVVLLYKPLKRFPLYKYYCNYKKKNVTILTGIWKRSTPVTPKNVFLHCYSKRCKYNIN